MLSIHALLQVSFELILIDLNSCTKQATEKYYCVYFCCIAFMLCSAEIQHNGEMSTVCPSAQIQNVKIPIFNADGRCAVVTTEGLQGVKLIFLCQSPGIVLD